MDGTPSSAGFGPESPFFPWKGLDSAALSHLAPFGRKSWRVSVFLRFFKWKKREEVLLKLDFLANVQGLYQFCQDFQR